MGRTREYNPDNVIDAAMLTFWKHGYEGASVRDLAKACGLTTRSMYNAYPDKDKFFEASMDRYHESVLNPIIQLIESKRGLDGLKQFVHMLGTEATADGCLFINTAASRHLVSQQAINKVERYVKRLKRAIRSKLMESGEDGKFKGDPDLRSSQLVMGILGFSMSMKAGFSKKEAAAVLTQIVHDIERG